MSSEKCEICKPVGFTCEAPVVGDRNKARILVANRGTQAIDLCSIENCSKRVEIFNQVAELIKR